MKPRALTLIASLLAAVALAACGGQSKEEKATSTVCDARDSIAKQVNTLKGMDLGTATVSQIQSSLATIEDDLRQIADAQGDLNGQRKSQVQQANDRFVSQIKDITSTLGSTTSVNQAKTEFSNAVQQLSSSYRKTFAQVDCG